MKKILTVEDELEINDFYKDLFEDFDYLVISATNHKEVMEVLKMQRIDLVILDNLLEYSHSSKNGMQTALDIKRISPKTHIIMVSAHYPPELTSTHMQYGIDALFKKPFNIEELLERVKAFLAS